MNTIYLSWTDVEERALAVVQQIRMASKGRVQNIYGIPNGGIFAAQVVAREAARTPGPLIRLVEGEGNADIFIDDIIDSGATRNKHPSLPFYALVNKLGTDGPGWYSFPWERMQKQEGPEDNIRRLLQFIGEDLTRDGLKDTPSRVVRSFEELYSGYKQDPAQVFKVFEQDTYDEMVLLRDVEFYSVCEHHMQPFFGKAHIAYIPDKRVLGISKLARLLEVYSRRLQIQERLCEQVTSSLMEYLQPLGAACVLEAKHFCMICRGVQKQNSVMVTTSLKGVFREPTVRAEFLAMVRG